MRSSKGTEATAMNAGELGDYVKKSVMAAYSNLINEGASFDNVITYFIAVCEANDALKSALNADGDQESKINSAFFNAMNCDELVQLKQLFFSPDIQTCIKALNVESKNVDVSKNLAKVGRDVKSVRRQVCTVEFSDDDKSVTCIQSELKNAVVLAKLQEQFDAKMKVLNPVVEATDVKRLGAK